MAGTFSDAPVAARAAWTHRHADVGSVAAAGLDGADVGEAAPRLADRGGGDAELTGELTHGGQAGTDWQLASRDQAPDDGGDVAGGAVAVADLGRDVACHIHCGHETYGDKEAIVHPQRERSDSDDTWSRLDQVSEESMISGLGS